MIAGLLLIAAVGAQATFLPPETEIVPVARLLKNVEAGLARSGNPEDRAAVEFRLGRLHSMAYALKTEQLQVLKKTQEPDRLRDVPDEEIPARDSAADKAAAKHLREAVAHLRRAVALAPKNSAMKLGLAWCLERSGQTAKAIALYRQIVASDNPVSTDQLGFDSAVAREAADSLTRLLDEERDAPEIAGLRTRIHTYTYSHPVTPIIVPLEPGSSRLELTADRAVRFDADGLNPRDFRPWPTSKAGWLVWDPRHSGKIVSGRQLFGSVAFWLFWKNGYEALAALDDNRDGKLEGAELDGLSIWQDLNGDGISQPGEVKPLSDWGIVSISVRAVRDGQGLWSSPDGVRFASGETRPTYDIVLVPEAGVLKPAPLMPHPLTNRSIPQAGAYR